MRVRNELGLILGGSLALVVGLGLSAGPSTSTLILTLLAVAWMGWGLWSLLNRVARPLEALVQRARERLPVGEGELEALEGLPGALDQARAEASAAEAALGREESRFLEITASVPGLVFQLERGADGALAFRFASAKASELLDLPASALVADPQAFFALVHPTDRETCLQALERSAADLEPFHWDVRMTTAAGREVWVSVTGTPRAGAEGAVAWNGFLVDATSRKHHEQALRDLTENMAATVAELENRDREMGLINRMNELIQSCQTRDEAYRLLGLSLREIFGETVGCLAVYLRGCRSLETVAQWGGPGLTHAIFPVEDCWALRRGHHHEVVDPGTSVNCQHFAQAPQGGYLCLPMLVKGEPLGLIHLDALPGQRVGYKEHQLAVTVAEAIKLSLTNLHLREALREQAIRDPLTGLFNRRYLEETLVRELHRAQRSGAPLAVAMLDVDHFKLFNDNFGHEAGDEVLKCLANTLGSGLRKSDVACRFGGEEFTLILPDSTQENARLRVEEIRKAFAASRIRTHHGELPGPTLSSGLAEAPLHGLSVEEILQAADDALYAAKQGGRNRVELFWGRKEKA